jgi:hypothetical protein
MQGGAIVLSEDHRNRKLTLLNQVFTIRLSSHLSVDRAKVAGDRSLRTEPADNGESRGPVAGAGRSLIGTDTKLGHNGYRAKRTAAFQELKLRMLDNWRRWM